MFKTRMVIIGVSYLIGLLMFCVNFNDDTGVARILSGGARFSSKELTTFFCSSPSKDGLKLLNQPLPLPNLKKMSYKLTLTLPGGALTNFHCKLRLNFFLRPGGAGGPTASPGYAYAPNRITLVIPVMIKVNLLSRLCTKNSICQPVEAETATAGQWSGGAHGPLILHR